MDLEVVEVGALVEHTLVDGLGDGVVDELADEETIVHRGEERVVLGVDGQAAADVPVLVQGVVDVIGEGLLLLHCFENKTIHPVSRSSTREMGR
jgi:hypothetical protein